MDCYILLVIYPEIISLYNKVIYIMLSILQSNQNTETKQKCVSIDKWENILRVCVSEYVCLYLCVSAKNKQVYPFAILQITIHKLILIW